MSTSKKVLHPVCLSKKKCVECGKALSAMNLDKNDKKSQQEVYADDMVTFNIARESGKYKLCS